MPCVANARECVEDDVDDGRREPEGRLVEEQDVRSCDECPRDRELLLLPTGERAGVAGAKLLHDREQLEDGLGIDLGGVAAAPRRVAEPQVLLDRQIGEDAPSLGHERDAAARNVLGLATHDRRPGEPDVAAARRDEAHDRVQRRRLAGAVRPDQPDDLAATDVEREVAHGGDAAVGDVEARDREHRLGHASTSCTALSPR